MTIIRNKMCLRNNKATITDSRHPKDKSSFLSFVLFCWQIPIVWKLRKNKIGENYSIIASKNLESSFVGKKLEENWIKETTKKNPSLMKVVIKTFSLELFLCGILYLPVDMTITVLQPLYLSKLLSYFTPNQTNVTKEDAYIYGSVITFALFLQVFSCQLFTFQCVTTGMKMRTSCCFLIYKKILNTRKATLQKVALGQVINLLSHAVDRFDRSLPYVQRCWMAVIKLMLLPVILYVWCGWQGAVGVVVLYVFLFSQYFIVKALASTTMKVSQQTDHRIRIISDVLSGIQTLKMYAWEPFFDKMVNSVRRSELKYVTASNHLKTTNDSCSYYIHKIPVYLYLLINVIAGTPINPPIVFMLISAMDLSKTTLLYASTGFNVLSETKNAVERIQMVLLQNEQVEKNQKMDHLVKDKILAKDLNAKWDLSSSVTTLKNVNFVLPSEHLVAIVGAAGSGKSTLLQTILKEVPITGGTLHVGGSVSYASQEPWIIPASVKQNIIFAEETDEEKYRSVLRACALEHDIYLFPYGDNTLVGERGVMLSGGQKARISLARAIYKDADIYLLDDPLSAVDTSVATQIFTECVLGYLKTKSVVLVTHQLRFLRNMDQVYVLESGEVKSCGRYEDLESLIGKSVYSYEEKHVAFPEIKDIKHCDQQFEIKEDEGKTKINLYKSYFMASGHWFFVVSQFFLFILCQLAVNSSDIFLTFWINLKQTFVSATVVNFFTDLNSLYVYTGILLIHVTVLHFSTWSFVECCKKTSTNLHKNLFGKTLRASMTFFNHHASGRIINRFSRDMGTIDEVIPDNMFKFIRESSIVIGVFFVVTIENFWMIFPTAGLLMLFYILSYLFGPAINQTRKISSIRRSPTFTHVSTTVQGLTTIKALRAGSKFLSTFDQIQNSFNAIAYLQNAIFYCYAFWVDISCAIYTVLIVFVTLSFEDTFVGNVGLSLTQSFLLIWSAQYAMKLYIELYSTMTSVERVVRYTDLDEEKDEQHCKISNSWPSHGEIIFDSVSMRYSEDQPLVLKRVNLKIQPGEKIGIVGRTGAGKSSLVCALFRLFEFEGKILIDGVDTKLISLQTLRSKISVIPQDPIFFLGTLRKNLDPFDEFDDNHLWGVLEDVKLKKVVANLPAGLESHILEGGGNFSVGQRQMLCLVRAILRNAKIIVLDEATANVDLETDEVIQATIRERFKGSTVLTIAHRLDTVMDSDKILVMEEGIVVEFGPTKQLLENTSSSFYKYANQK